MRTWKKRKLDYLNLFYGDIIEKWNFKKCRDDRKICANIFDQITEAILTLPDNPCVYIAVAMNKAINEDCKAMDEIINRFNELGVIHLSDGEAKWYKEKKEND